MKCRFAALGLAVGVALSGCAKKAEDIAPQYVSPLSYQSYSCRQVGEEAQRITNQASRLTGVQDKKAHNDAVATGVAIVLFWPAAFFIKGNGENAGELARLRGELEALEKISIAKNCGIEFRTTAPQEVKPPAKE